ncbi:MAG: CDP-diacylglycerol--glycerol-3-phosphate 3-phosphatidyltransferase [Phycisphaeraceae bacterium]|nr:CDP-diacylglycerol--glycerol-3-phosphate 3-phosphatidyltransferase [Phycisphaeraceae bacterium]
MPPTEGHPGRAPVAGPDHPAAGWVYRSLPNLLTTSRVLLAVVFFVLLSWYRHRASVAPGREGSVLTGADWLLLWAAAVFGVAAITDALDGYFARRWQQVSVFGRIMDPFADKLLVVGAFVFLAGPGFSTDGRPAEQISGVYPWMVVVVLGRELLVTSIRAAFEGAGVSFGASLSGKLKMVLQSVCVPAVLVLIALADPGESPHHVAEPARLGRVLIDTIVWATMAATVWSGLPYIWRAWKVVRDGRGPGAGA